jgi:hypothetical protein
MRPFFSVLLIFEYETESILRPSLMPVSLASKSFSEILPLAEAENRE